MSQPKRKRRPLLCDKATKAAAAASATVSDAAADRLLQQRYEQEIRPLLKLNDQLRKLSHTEADINVSSIVVVGDQSHGKTSLIQALSGVDLPRGEGIQTRVPLVLKLRMAEEGVAEHGEIEAKGIEKRRVELANVADEVRRCTDLLAGGTNDVKDVQLELTVYRHNQDDLTLIDLPGMTRVPMEGQHTDIEATIIGMYQRYMEPSESVLLNVVTAMVDPSTSKSLDLARQFDPHGRRTLLCITKVDQHADPGLAETIMKNCQKLRLPLENAFCVRNRTQPENDSNTSLAEAREKEQAFFAANTGLQALPTSSKGVVSLTARLVTLQRERILETLPNTEAQIRRRKAELEAKLKDLAPPPDTDGEVQAELVRRLSVAARACEDEAIGHVRRQQPALDNVTEEVIKLTLTHPAESSLKHTIGHGDGETGTVWLMVKRNSPSAASGSQGSFESTKSPAGRAQGGAAAAYSFGGLAADKCEAFIVVEMREHVSAMSFVAEIHGSLEKHLDFTAARGTGRFLLSLGSIAAYSTISAILSLTDVEYSNEPPVGMDHQLLLCATLCKLDDEFHAEFAKQHPTAQLLSSGMRKRLLRELDPRRGSPGLPDTISPAVAEETIRTMRQPLKAIVVKYENSVHQAATRVFAHHFQQALHDWPRMAELAKNAVTEMMATMHKEAYDACTLIMNWEQTLFTKNHYYMDTVNKLKKRLLQDENEDDEPETETGDVFSIFDGEEPTTYDKRTLLDRCFVSLREVRGKSNEQQRLVDLQLEVAVYWKVLKKRMVDYVVMATRYALCRKPVENGFALHHVLKAITEQVESSGQKLTFLASQSEAMTRMVADVRHRLQEMTEAERLLDQFCAQRTRGKKRGGDPGGPENDGVQTKRANVSD